jgi:hypothetical protein
MNKKNICCPKCKSIYFSKQGKRKKRNETIFRYKCLRCNILFSSPIEVIKKFSNFSSENKKTIIKYKFVEYDFKSNNYSIIFPKIKVTKKISIENYVKKYYESLNYKVKRLSSTFIINGKYFSIKGLPDLHINNKKESFFLEIKTNNDGIKFNQLLFLTKFCGKVIFIFEIDEKVNLETFTKIKEVKKGC